jgi:hypothetical protein
MMKRHIIAGLLSMFVLAPVVEVFSASGDQQQRPFLTPEQREELGVQAPSFNIEFPFAPSGALGLTFLLIVTNRTATDLPIVLTTVPSGQTPIQRPFTLGPSQIAGFGPTDVTCATGLICRLIVSFAGGDAPFDALLEILTTAGQPVAFVTQPIFWYFTQ